MKKLFIIANWKSNKTTVEAREWLESITTSNKEIIICPPFTLLSTVNELITRLQLPIKVGAQDISPFDSGAYTGEVNARQIKEFADYVIIGHSERRQNFQEEDSILEQKIAMAIKYQITPLFCVQGQATFIPKGVDIIAYEPVLAIGTGNADTPKNADTVAKAIKEKNSISFVLYGGSVTADNIKSFTEMPNVDGVLVGAASLDSQEFIKIINNA